MYAFVLLISEAILCFVMLVTQVSKKFPTVFNVFHYSSEIKEDSLGIPREDWRSLRKAGDP
jgi:hypothetical protein